MNTVVIKPKAWAMALGLFFAWPFTALADPGPLAQTPILTSAASAPNILIVIDDSGSMGWRRSGQPKTPMHQAQDAAIALLDSLSKVRVGVGSFSRYNFGGELDQPIVDLDANRALIYKAVRDLYPRGGTPLVGTLQHMGRYFVGLGGTVNPGNSASTNCTANGQYRGALTLHPDDAPRGYPLSEVFPSGPNKGWTRSTAQSPVCHWCQKNFLILLTDGWGWGDASTPLRNYCPTCYHPLISVAAALNDIDLRPDVDDFEGSESKNNLVTYTIGFHTSQALLKETAKKGGGLYFEADNESELTAAFAKIGEDILAHTSGSASAATFSTSLLQSGTDLYLTTFNTEYWTGDVIAGTLDPSGRPGGKRWSAANRLDTASNPDTRVMLSWNSENESPTGTCPGSSTKAAPKARPGGIPFRWDYLSTLQQRDLLDQASASGNLVYERKWGSTGSGGGKFGLPFDVATDSQGNVYVVDYNNHLVQKFDLDGTFLTQWGGTGSGVKNLNYPVGIATDKDDNVYVAQHGSHTVKKFNAAGDYLASYGGYGLAPDQLYYPFDVAVDSSGNLYVVELQSHRIKVFDASGNFVREWGGKGSAAGRFWSPNRIAIDLADNVYVSDYVNHRIQKFDTDGNFLAQWGSYGTGDGQFRYPYGVATDGSGNVFVVEYFNRVQQFDAAGNFIEKWGSSGSGDGQLRYPRGIGVYDGGVCAGSSFFVADAYNYRVQKFSSPGSAHISAEIGKARLRYLRGERTNEKAGWGFRERQSLLGDIIHSSAVYVGKPSLNWPSGGAFPSGDKAYSRFARDKRSRRPVVAAGANDGMLHVFAADNGNELLAYLPGNLFSSAKSQGYHYLTDPDYAHRYYVDGTPAVSDVFIPSRFSTTAQWRSVLVGIEGSGGRGLFALDVTDPDRFAEANATDLVLWEFSSVHDPHLGRTLARPTIALLPNGRWAAIVGNGYQHTATGTPSSGQAELFVIYLDGGLDRKWSEGRDYLRIPTGVGSVSRRNGLSTPAVIDTDGDRVADRVYAGDIQGNLWAFDLSSNKAVDWKVAHGGPLFSGARKQPITARPEIIRHPAMPLAGNQPNLMIFFGTGQYLVPGDNTTTDTQSFYAVWDRGDGKLERSDLVEQVFLRTNQSGGRVTDPDRWQELKVDYKKASAGDRYGWYLDLPDSGERVVTDARYRGGLIFFNTLVPTDPRPCAAGGTGWMMSVDALTGGSPLAPAFDFDGNGEIDTDGDTEVIGGEGGKKKRRIGFAGKKYYSKNGIPTGVSIIGDNRYTAGSGTDDASEVTVEALQPGDDAPAGRMSWDQLLPE